MPSLQFKGQLFPLREGDTVLGADPSDDIQLPDLEPQQRVGISVEPVGSFAWAPGEAGVARINGRALDGEPVPLFHGDRLELGQSVLVFCEDGREPHRVPDSQRAAAMSAAPAGARGAEARTAAIDPEMLRRMTPPTAPQRQMVAALRRLDNQQLFLVNRAGFRIGREKRCDLIIPDPSVSRLHAEIVFSGGRYVLRDLGRTGTIVNGRRLEEPHTLKVGDVIQVGDCELAFLRRPADAADGAKAMQVTPVRNAVPDAPTVMPVAKGGGGSRVLSLLLLAVLAAAVALVLLG